MEPTKGNRLAPTRIGSRTLPELLEKDRPSPPLAEEGAEAIGPVLQIRDSGGTQRIFNLDRDVIHLGRQTVNDIQFLESHVSKRHAKIVREDNQFRILDVGSKAGVYINGKPVKEHVLMDGDVITFGLSSMPTLIFSVSGGDTTFTSHSKLMSALGTSSGEQSLDKLARFLEFNRLIGSRITLVEILENVIDVATELTDAERGFLILKADDGTLDYRMARDSNRRPIPLREIRVSETIVRETLSSGVTRVVTDILEEDSLVGQESVLSLNLRSAIALPLKTFSLPEENGSAEMEGHDIFGVLYLDSRQTHASFSRLDRGILETLANNASSVIENARLYREAEDKRRMEEEFARAREVQEALLPQKFWETAHFEVAGSCTPCFQLGGDYLDQIRMPGGDCCFVIADVAGKGMSAALLAAALQGMMAAETSMRQPLGRLVERINFSIYRLRQEGRFVTFFCGILTPRGDLTYVNAGHVPPMVISRKKEIQTLFTGSMALGFRQSVSYQERTIRLDPGDVVFLYTDGVTEAEGDRGEMFGEDRLTEVLNSAASRSAEEIHLHIKDEVDRFCGEAPQRDDVTLMVLKFLGNRS